MCEYRQRKKFVYQRKVNPTQKIELFIKEKKILRRKYDYLLKKRKSDAENMIIY